jgi:hypothetical protein
MIDAGPHYEYVRNSCKMYSHFLIYLWIVRSHLKMSCLVCCRHVQREITRSNDAYSSRETSAASRPPFIRMSKTWRMCVCVCVCADQGFRRRQFRNLSTHERPVWWWAGRCEMAASWRQGFAFIFAQLDIADVGCSPHFNGLLFKHIRLVWRCSTSAGTCAIDPLMFKSRSQLCVPPCG